MNTAPKPTPPHKVVKVKLDPHKRMGWGDRALFWVLDGLMRFFGYY